MLRAIIQHSVELVAFIQALDLALYQPQKRHLLHIIDALLMHSRRKTLSALYRLLAEAPGPKAAVDSFVEAPGKWKPSVSRASPSCYKSC